MSGGPCQAPSAALLRKGERLLIADSQKGLAWKPFPQPHLPMQLLAQRHRDWGCFFVLPPQTSNVARVWGGPCQSPPAALLRHCECLHSQKTLAWKAVAQPHLPMALFAQRHRDWGCLLVLPPQTSNVSWERVYLPGSFCSPAPKMRMSAGSLQAEGASLERCCSASSAHGTVRIEAQRMGLLAYLAT